MNDSQAKFIGNLAAISPEEFREKVAAAERAVKLRKAVRGFAKQFLIGMAIGLVVGGPVAFLVHAATHGGF